MNTKPDKVLNQQHKEQAINQHKDQAFNHHKYQAFKAVQIQDRQWPDQTITRAPQWCSVDLRDGNQALIEPMSVAQKIRLFKLLVQIGFKEIEVGFPSASQADYDFVRKLIEENRIPGDVTIAVLTPARETFIRRSFESLKGINQAIVHLYNSTSKIQRERVFGLNTTGITDMAVNGAKIIQQCASAQPETRWRFQYSPESFTGTELDYAVEVCDAVNAVWKPTAEHPVIINLPSTVEMATPNVYADQIEWFSRRIAHREAVILSLHTHNDRGCAVAAAELAVMAGAQRVEGTLLGNGERTGNMDIITMAMNLYSQGIDPELDLSDIYAVSRQVSQLIQIAVHPRHPYVGDLVFTAFSGSHQDAIRKCIKAQQPGDKWEVAYLPIDPADLGRSYKEVIRINSQSGKGGMAYILEQAMGIQLPRWLQIEFSKVVQQAAEQQATEISAEKLVALFQHTYLTQASEYQLKGYQIEQNQIEQQDNISVQLMTPEGNVAVSGQGQGALEAFTRAIEQFLHVSVNITEYNEHALSAGSDAKAISYIQMQINGSEYIGIARHQDVISASLNALLKGVDEYILQHAKIMYKTG
jgi:2-isopropylmalate synthase